jgi:hypothetical protein
MKLKYSSAFLCSPQFLRQEAEITLNGFQEFFQGTLYFRQKCFLKHFKCIDICMLDIPADRTGRKCSDLAASVSGIFDTFAMSYQNFSCGIPVLIKCLTLL